MGTTVKLSLKPTKKIESLIGIDKNGAVQKYFTKRCADYMDKYVPMDKGDLRTIIDIQSNCITYEIPYARYQYYGVREDGTHEVKNYTTPGTGTYWDKRMVSAEINDLVEEVQDYIRRK